MNSVWFLKIISEHCNLDPAKLVIAGVSGGPDSITLLHLLLSSNIQCIAVHFDHELRPESSADARFVADYCHETGTKFILGKGDVASYAETNRISIEEGARELRYRFLFEQAMKFHAQAVLVGHNKDDQVETILMHLIRGTGTSGLTGMRRVLTPNPWSDSIPVVRPLLEVTRSEILEYCQQNSLRSISDSSNSDTLFFRNRIRKELLPQLVSYNPSFKDRIQKMGDVISLEDDYLSDHIDAFWKQNQLGRFEHIITLEKEKVLGLHPALLRRLVRRMICHLKMSTRDIDFEAIEKAVNFLNGTKPSNYIELFAGIEMFLAMKGTVIVATKDQSLEELWPQMQTSEMIEIPFNGEVPISERWKLMIRKVPGIDWNADPFSCSIKIKNNKDSLILRCAKKGDRFTPFGMNGKRKKLGDFWTDEGLPPRARRSWPLLCCGDEILWVPGFRISDGYKVEDDSEMILNLTFVKTK